MRPLGRIRPLGFSALFLVLSGVRCGSVEVPGCGNGRMDPGEPCDPSAGGVHALGCRATCTLIRCGDGTLDPEEECDSGDANSDEKPNACRTSWKASCGDGAVDSGEECDDRNRASGDGCSSSCRKEACPSPPLGYGERCSECYGRTTCDGSCSVEDPENLGALCGSCGGKIGCDGKCTVKDPENVGLPCGKCGGTYRCDGICSVRTPENLGKLCGKCGGVVQCDGTCTVPTPENWGEVCNRCGDRFTCDGCPKRISCTPMCGFACTAAKGALMCDSGCSGDCICKGSGGVVEKP